MAETIADLPREIAGIDAIEIMVVDDGSSDGTAALAEKLGVDHLVRLGSNRGLATAFRRGSEYALAQAPTSAQLQKLDDLVNGLQARYGIADNQVWAHSHLKETACPGPAMMDWVAERRASGRAGHSHRH